MRIKDIPKENRPRERLKQNGVDALSNSELLAVILQKGTQKENVIDMSNRLLSKYSIDKLSDCSLTELKAIPGIGDAKAMQIKAIFEINKRNSVSKTNGKAIKSAKDVFDYMFPKLSGLDKEHFVVLFLDSKNHVIKEETVSVGILNASLIHPREVFKSAIKESANSIILVHNHPSGDCEPSEGDLNATCRVRDSGKVLKINLIDHVIVSKDGYYSFKENSKM